MTLSRNTDTETAGRRGARLAGRGLFLAFMLVSVMLGLFAVVLTIGWLSVPAPVIVAALVLIAVAAIKSRPPGSRREH